LKKGLLEMANLHRYGVNIYYEVHGDAGPAILLTHGYTESGAMWKDQFEALSSSYRLIVWDMRGHGRTDYPEDLAAYSEENTVEDMKAILDAEHVDAAVIGGMSLGGYMSLAFYRRYPERVKALVLVDTGPGMKNDQARKEWNQWALDCAEQFREAGLGYLDIIGERSGYTEHRSAAGLVNAAIGMLTQKGPEVINSLPGIAVPTLLIVGENDTPFLQATEYMEQKIPNAKRLVFPDAGHVANVDQAGLFNRSVLEFLAETVGDA